ncbi:MAG: type II secretion system protein [Betaproteobacteria bacterium]
MPPTLRRLRGFSLVELAVVLIIVSLLTGGLLLGISAQQNSVKTSDAARQMENITEALVGFAVINGRLPCPASAASRGQESYSGTLGKSPCSTYHGGFLPAATLGVAPTDSDGFALDPWGTRVRYAVSSDPDSDAMDSNANGAQRHTFTTTDGIRSLGLAAAHPDIHVCSGGAAQVSTASARCASPELTHVAVAVIVSGGPNGRQGALGSDEQGNGDGDRVFVSRTVSDRGTAGGEFDDIVAWISPNVIYSRLIAAGRLP